MSSKIGVSEEIPAFPAQNDEVPISLTVNGELHEKAVASDLPLVHYLRDGLGLTGTKFGCETGQCGMCTVLVDGVSAKSCAMLAAQADGHHITTIEGLATNSSLNSLQTSFSDAHAVQCGYCSAGMLLSLTDLLSRNSHPSEAEIRLWMDGILCRCGVYQNAVRAVQALSRQKQ